MTALKPPSEKRTAPKARASSIVVSHGGRTGQRPAGVTGVDSSQFRTEATQRKALLFARIVSAKHFGGIKAVKLIRDGYPAEILKSASYFFDVPDSRIRVIVKIPASTASRLEKSNAKIDSAATERVYRMGAVARMAIDVFENEALAIKWMRQPNHALGDVAPLDLMDTEPGAATVRQVLNAIATGGVA